MNVPAVALGTISSGDTRRDVVVPLEAAGMPTAEFLLVVQDFSFYFFFLPLLVPFPPPASEGLYE